MKVNIGKYPTWLGPYQLAELLCFWVKKVPDEHGFKHKPDWVHDFGEWLAGKDDHDTKLTKFLHWVQSKRKRKEYVHIDEYDTWNMDSTLALIILPMLKQLKETKHGSANVENEDVPEYLRSTNNESYEQLSFDFYHKDAIDAYADVHKRWDWVLDQMIFAFERIVDDSWEEKYSSGEHDHIPEPCAWDADGKPTSFRFKEGPNHTYKCDFEGMKREQDQIDNGLRLFGKYYRGLWD